MRHALISTSIESESRYYCIAWNPSGGLLLDVFQSIEQRILGDWSQFWRYLGNLDLAPDWFQSLAVNIASGIDRLSFVNDSYLQIQVAMYRAQLAAGRKIVVVSHSQGNFYANEANNILYNGLDGQPPLRTKSFGVVAVAEPADNVAGKDRPYTTLLTDSVILAVVASAQAAGLPLPLLPNTLDFCLGLCHVFEEPYLKEGTNSRRKILSDVIDVITQLISPNTSPPALGIWNEDFESISAITQTECSVGSEGYAVAGHTFTIDSSHYVSPGNALRATNPGLGLVCFGSTNLLPSGSIVNMWVRFDSTSSSNTSTIKLVTQPAAAPPKGCEIEFRNGEVFAVDTDDGSVVPRNIEQIGTFSPNAWYRLSFFYTTGVCRMSFDSGTYSSDMVQGSGEIYAVYVSGFVGASMWVDDISSGPAVSQ